MEEALISFEHSLCVVFIGNGIKKRAGLKRDDTKHQA